MNRKRIVIVIVLVLVMAIAAGIWAYIAVLGKTKSTAVSATTSVPTPANKEEEELLQWTDPAGFSLRYPKNLALNEHKEDTLNYAHLEFTHPQHPGSIVIWMKDTTAASVTDYIQSDKALKGQPSIDTTLGGHEAKKVSLKGDKPRQIVAALDEDVVVIVDTDLTDSQFWSQTADTLVSSFAFLPDESAPAAGSQGAASTEDPVVEADEEETVE